jgi:anti-sigma factor RsiW
VLVAWLDGELTLSKREAVRRHLDRCEACRAEADLLEETGRLLDQPEAPPVRPGFTARMMARVVEEKDLEAMEARLRPHRRRRKVLASAAGLAAGLVLGFVAYGWTGLMREPNSPVEREVSHNVSFLKDVELLDAIAVIEAMDRLTSGAATAPGDTSGEAVAAEAPEQGDGTLQGEGA